ncbi:glutathione transferase [Massilia sp. S19_KUP03_FR1]|uniref:glutathione transferase n=1 Tax=Massilia sp. S19_KUP03_FR1 TaxID=3025503 RepID=UPI002FCDC7EE
MPHVLTVDSLFTSPWAMSVFVALTEKGVPFSVDTLDLAAGQQHGDYAARSLTARVPALADGEFVLTESTAITEYLEECFPAPAYPALYPHDRHARARARQVQAWLRTDLLAVRVERDTETLFLGKPSAPLSPGGQAAAAKLIHVAGQLVRGPCLFDAWSIADVDLALMLQRLVVAGDPMPPALAAYAARQWERPSVRQWLGRHAPA